MDKISVYKGYDLMHELYDDADGFVKHIYAVYKDGELVRYLQSNTYTTIGLQDNFEEVVDQELN